MDNYISIKEFQEKVDRQEFYRGYVIGVGYAFYAPLIIRPEKSSGSVLLDGDYSVIWIQKIDNSPAQKMKSLKQNPKKWSDIIGSTKLQRFAAKEFAKKHNGTIANENWSDVHVIYTETVGSMSLKKEQFFHEDGTLVSQQGEISEMKVLSNIEMWLNSKSNTALESICKIIGNFGYGYPNSISILLRGRTLAGSSTNCNDKVAALIDIGPGLILWGAKATNLVTKVKGGLQGYNQFVKKNSYLKGNKGLPTGTPWQRHAGKTFQTNKQNLNMLKSADDFLDETSIINISINEVEK